MTKVKKDELKVLEINDTPYKTEYIAKFENRKPWVAPDNRKITAFLPGTITKILVKKGDKIKEGQIVVTFEAMKMINNVQTMVAGTVKDIFVKEGDRFPKGFVLLEIE